MNNAEHVSLFNQIRGRQQVVREGDLDTFLKNLTLPEGVVAEASTCVGGGSNAHFQVTVAGHGIVANYSIIRFLLRVKEDSSGNGLTMELPVDEEDRLRIATYEKPSLESSKISQAYLAGCIRSLDDERLSQENIEKS